MAPPMKLMVTKAVLSRLRASGSTANIRDWLSTFIAWMAMSSTSTAIRIAMIERCPTAASTSDAMATAIAVAIASLVLAAVGQRSIIAILIAVLVLDIAIQAMNVLNQSRMFAVDPEARSRLNTAFVTINFIGGAIGSALASVLWHVGGWTAVMIGGSGLLAVALVVWAVHRRGRLVVPVPAAG